MPNSPIVIGSEKPSSRKFQELFDGPTKKKHKTPTKIQGLIFSKEQGEEMPHMNPGKQGGLENLDRLATLSLEDLVKWMADQGVLGAINSGKNDNRELKELEKQARLSTELRSK